MKQQLYPQKPILIVDDEWGALENYRTVLEGEGLNNLLLHDDSRDVMSLLSKQEAAFVILDLNMPYLSGEELLQEIKIKFPELHVIIVTAVDDMQKAIACMKAGAFDYLTKPLALDALLANIRRILQMIQLEDEVHALTNTMLDGRLKNPQAFGQFITCHPKMFTIFKYMEGIVRSTEPILVCGESGTGKEVIANAMYKLSGVRGEFVKVNVAGLDEQTFSDTIFGHKRGAFTGAERDRAGMIATAEQGMIFLDEIGDLSLTSQVKLLRLIQENEYYPLGSDKVQKSTARIIVATNRDLDELRAKGEFRPDLYFRLKRHFILLPPLRERIETDLSLLIDHFLEQAALRLHKLKPTVPPELYQLLATYHFPGNIRELESIIFDAVSRHESKVLSLASVTEYFRDSKGIIQGISNEPVSLAVGSEQLPANDATSIHYTGRFPRLKEVEDFFIIEAMKKARDIQSIAAKLLGIAPPTLNKRLKKIQREQKTKA